MKSKTKRNQTSQHGKYVYLLYPSITQAIFEVFRNKNPYLKKAGYFWGALFYNYREAPCNTRNVLVKK